MAILKGLIRKLKGSAGDFTFRNSQGRTIVSEKITETTDRKTSAQQKHRMKWANVIQMYKGIIPLLDCAFENKTEGVTDYNMFVKMNMQMQPVYLTKSQVAGGACVVAPYIISQGSLPAIVVTGTGANGVTDINLGTLTIDETTTVAQFANAVVANNTNFDYNDQISFFRIEQRQNNATGLPYGIFKAFSVVLDKTSTALLLAMVPAEGFTVVDGKLGHLSTVAGDYAYAWVHSRRANGQTKVSSQVLISNNSLLSRYTSNGAYLEAVASYGGEKKVFLTPSVNDDDVINDNDDDNDNPGGGSGSGENEGGNTPEKKTLTLSASPANGGSVSGGGQYDQGATANITATPANGFTFTRWSDGNTNASRSVTVNSDMTLTVIFTATTPDGEGGGDEEDA